MDTLLNLLDLNAIILLIGIIFRFFLPKKINMLYGYRTRMSTINQETWTEAQQFSSKRWIIYFAFATVLSAIIKLLFPLKVSIMLSVAMVISGLILVIIKTELHLRKTFNDEGIKK